MDRPDGEEGVMGTTEALRTGWDAGSPSADTLALAAARAMADRAARWAIAAGGRVERAEGLVLADAGAANPFLNQAVSTRLVDAALVRRVLAFYPADRPFLLVTPRDHDDASSPGLRVMGHPPFMIRPANPVEHGRPAGVRVGEVTDRTGLAAWAEVAAAGFGLPAAPVPPALLGSPHRFWLGYHGGEVAAVSAAYVGHGVVDVEAVATLPEHRGRGLGAAVTWAATLADPGLPAVLLASDPGRPVYERMGYLPITRWTLFTR